MEKLIDFLKDHFPLYDMLRNDRARLLFKVALFLYVVAAFFHADFESSLLGLRISHRSDLAIAAFVLAGLALAASITCSIVLGKDTFPTVAKVLEHYVGRKGGLDFAAFFRDASDVSRVLYYANEDELKGVLAAIDHSEVEPQQMIDQWLRLAREIHQHLSGLDRVLVPTAHGHNIRLVFDPECGGLFYTRIDGKRFVFGATLDQRRLHNDTADKEMRLIVRALRDLLSVHA